jgi:hypothetical protein
MFVRCQSKQQSKPRATALQCLYVLVAMTRSIMHLSPMMNRDYMPMCQHELNAEG